MIAPFPNLTAFDVGRHKEFPSTFYYGYKNQKFVPIIVYNYFSAYGPASRVLAWNLELYSKAICLAKV